MNRRLNLVLLLASSLLGPTLAAGAWPSPLRVDINPDNGRKDVLTKGWDDWRVGEGASKPLRLGNATVAFRIPRTGGAKRIEGAMWKGGYDTGATLASDGLVAHGGAVELVISGLPAGRTGIATYHNAFDAQPSNPFSISVNGQAKAGAITCSHRVADDYNAATAFVEVEAAMGEEVVLRFTPAEPSGSIIINGLVIGGADPAEQARKPFPVNLDEHAAENPTLAWTPAKSAVSHDVYLGTSREAVARATRQSPEFKGIQQQPTFATSGLNTFDTYYWRVDQIGTGEKTTKGDVWSFRVRHLAFPGAEGYGRFARGGRGGEVYEVTNLNDAGPGSLREAVEAEGPRTVVFRVGGTINLKSKLVIKNPYITIAGQTAPGDGIATRGYTFGVAGAHDVIIRYVRIRIGDESGQTMDGSGMGGGTDHAIMDHCSIAWSIDEGFSSRGGRNITLQRSIIAEPLNMSIHSHYVGSGKGHGYAGSISGDIGSFHHNLLANCAGRNWSLAGGLTGGNKFAGHLDIRNNVVYNWHHRTNDGGVRNLNLVGNYYIPGPATEVFHLLKAVMEMKLPDDVQQYYVSGNVMEGRPQYNPDNWKNGGVIGEYDRYPDMVLAKPFCPSFITEQSAKDAYESVIADVGANFPRYDAIDARTVRDVQRRGFTYKGSKTGLPGIPDSVQDVGGYVELKGGPAPADRDHDGMPDAWEQKHNLNPDDPHDGNRDAVGDGYTNLERYLNSIPSAKPLASAAR
ncbi:MAG TPA: hypothetical protein VGR35_02680 [Tepidisphaeraceae bacterium]|nr:hypothetical protein [Tepidisphaeraceae bacterium]